MANNLTEADETEHRITFREAGKADKKICAAYVTTEDKHPDMLAFKDHRNRTVLLVSRESVLAVERVEQQGGCADSGPKLPASLSHYWTGVLDSTAGVQLTKIRCNGCKTEIPVGGNAAGLTLDEMVKAAEDQMARECPAHEIIRLAA
jgi:hypothetical protein